MIFFLLSLSHPPLLLSLPSLSSLPPTPPFVSPPLPLLLPRPSTLVVIVNKLLPLSSLCLLHFFFFLFCSSFPHPPHSLLLIFSFIWHPYPLNIQKNLIRLDKKFVTHFTDIFTNENIH